MLISRRAQQPPTTVASIGSGLRKLSLDDLKTQPKAVVVVKVVRTEPLSNYLKKHENDVTFNLCWDTKVTTLHGDPSTYMHIVRVVTSNAERAYFITTPQTIARAILEIKNVFLTTEDGTKIWLNLEAGEADVGKNQSKDGFEFGTLTPAPNTAHHTHHRDFHPLALPLALPHALPHALPPPSLSPSRLPPSRPPASLPTPLGRGPGKSLHS